MKTCGNCKFWESVLNGSGECRRRSPTITPSHRDEPKSIPADLEGHWPRTDQEAWCGEHIWNGASNP